MSLRQFIVTPTQQSISLLPSTVEVDLVSRGGNLAVSVGEGPQDVEFDGKILPAGDSVTLTVGGGSTQVAVMLVEPEGIGMLQIAERSEPSGLRKKQSLELRH